MADLNLRKLSAPVEALRPKVDAAYKALDAKWKAVAEQLKALPIPCAISCTVSTHPSGGPEYITLDWRKWNGSKRICHVFHEYDGRSGEGTEDVTPYDEWSAEQRLEMLEHIPALFKAAERQVNAFVAKIEKLEVRE